MSVTVNCDSDWEAQRVESRACAHCHQAGPRCHGEHGEGGQAPLTCPRGAEQKGMLHFLAEQ